MFFYQHDNAGQTNHVDPELYVDFSFPMHLHTDLELVLLRKGAINLHLRGRTETLAPGDFALVLPNELHAYSTPEHSESFVCVFSSDYVPAFLYTLAGKRGERSVFAGTNILRAQIENAFFTDSSQSALELKAVFYAVCAQFLREIPLNESRCLETDILEKLIRYVEENFREDISMASAAQALGYNRSYLSRQFHQALNINFRSFINYQRVQYVFQQMRAGETNISELALSSGFQNLRSFNRAFKSLMGDTPRTCRKTSSSEHANLRTCRQKLQNNDHSDSIA